MKKNIFLSIIFLVILGYIEIFEFKLPHLIVSQILTIRLWRLFLGIYGGAVLGITGVIMQSITGNPLMDPYLSGVSAGAGFGGVVIIALLGSSIMNILFGTFIGGFIAFFTVYFILKLVKSFSGGAIVLTGLSIGFLYSSLMIIAMMIGKVGWGRVIFMLYGNLNRPISHSGIILFLILFALSIPMIVYSFVKWKDLNLILLGDNSSKAMGVNVVVLKEIFLLIVSFLIAVTVSFAGMIGFIGIMAPHISRKIVGGDHRFLMVSSIIMGGVILLFSDILSRKLFPVQLPITVISSLLGVPFFLYLLLRNRK